MKNFLPCLFALSLCATLFLTGCEDIFGKESSQRGALPGKREDVFSDTRALKADATLAEAPVEIPTAADVNDWAQPGGTLARVHGNVSLASEPSEAWSVSIGSGASKDGALAATPVIAAGKIYTVDADAVVSAFSAQSGERLWQKAVPDTRPEDTLISGSGLAIDQGKLVVTTSYGYVVALDAASGKQLWLRNLLIPIRSAPIISNDKVYVVTMNNTLQEIALADGTLGWNHSGIQETASFLGAASPTATDELIVAPYSSGEIFGLRRINGRMVWEENLASTKRLGTLPTMADIEGQPVLHNNHVHVISHSGRFVALDLLTGKRIWEADAGSIQTPWFAGNSVFIVTTENQLAALSDENGHVRWAVDLLRFIDPDDHTTQMTWVGPVMAGGKLWLGNSQGELKSYDPKNGKELSSRSFSAPIYLPPVVAGRTLYVLTDDGRLTALR